MKSIVVLGRRWFRRSYSNTYTSVEVYVDGKLSARIGPTSGYGDYYLQLAGEVLHDTGQLQPAPEVYRNGGREGLRSWADRAGVALSYSVTDVARERDL